MNTGKALFNLNVWVVMTLAMTTLFFSGCGSGEQRSATTDLTEIQGGRYSGGVLRYNETEYLRSLYPLNVSEVVGHRISNQIYEGLVALSQDDLSVVPALAESWDIDSGATLYTFHLRKGVRYHDNECFEGGLGREVTANDFMYCFTRLLTSASDNKGFVFVKDRILGGAQYYDATQGGAEPSGGIEGLRVLDDYTFQIELTEPFSAFLGILSMPFCYAFPKEAVDMYGSELRVKAVGTGPFMLRAVRENDNVILGRNPNYWATDEFGNQLPYLNGVNCRFISEEKSEMLAFKKGDFELKYRIPPEMFQEAVQFDANGNRSLKEEYAQYTLQYQPVMTVEYYGFLHPDEIFANKLVRQAFCYAIDREKICEFTVQNTAAPAFYGIVPPAFPAYDNSKLKGYTFDPDRSRQLFKEAGYENGKGFPPVTLQINSGGGRNEMVAEAIQKMLEETLNIRVEIQQIEFAQHYENLESGKARFWRAGWVADYPDPENFLNLLYGVHVPEKLSDNSYINSVRYQSEAYNAVFSEALHTVDREKRYEKYLQAEQIALDDAAILPIYYNIIHRMLQPYVRNFPQNAMEYRDFSEVWLVPQSAPPASPVAASE